MGLRLQDPIPEWITHIALVQGGGVKTGERSKILEELKSHAHEAARSAAALGTRSEAGILVDMRNVNVRYHERHVRWYCFSHMRILQVWYIGFKRYQLVYACRGSLAPPRRERYVGHYYSPEHRECVTSYLGSGKTTLLSVLTGDHPQSYTQRAPTSALTLFGAPRRTHATTHLRACIGVVSPELYNAWPRARNMSVWEAIATGFDGGFVPLGPHGLGVGLHGELSESERAWRAERVWTVLRRLGPHTWRDGADVEDFAEERAESVEEFAQRPFSGLPAGVQSVVLLMRALVGRPPLVLLDEVWAGMDDGMNRAARAYLRDDGVGEDQAVVVISHWEDEVPWGAEDGVKRFRLEGGEGAVLLE
jgi:ABC-type molybdenum transport system ATPase subunit/photorepair protein PhrA